MEDLPFILLGLFFVIGVPVAALTALARANGLRREVLLLRREVTLLKQSLAAPPAAAQAPVVVPTPAQPQPAPAAPPVVAPPAPELPRVPPQKWPAAAKPRKITERTIASRWMVWVGGIALALGGVFMVRYSIEQGYLGPTVRIVLGIVAGLAMLGAGEMARRHPGRPMAQASYIPAVVTGAGFLTLFASIYAGYALYALFPPIVTFALLGAVALGAIAISLLHGQAMALFGLVGSIAVPILVASNSPVAVPLFGYLAVVAAALGAIARLRHWWIVLAATMAGGAFWVVMWLLNVPAATQPVAVGLFLLFLAALPLWVTWDAIDRERVPNPLQLAFPEYVVWISGAGMALLAFILVRFDNYGGLSLAVLGATAALYLAAAWRVPAWQALPVAAALAVLAALATWHVPLLETYTGEYPELAQLHPVESPDFDRFNAVAGGFALLFGLTGFMALRLRRQAGFWAGLSVAVPILTLFVSYWRWTEFRSDAGWAAVGLGLAGVATFAAERRQLSRGALGAYATGAVAALSLALAMILREAWLTAALSLQLPATAAISLRLDLPFLRRVALAVAALVLARLLLNPSLLDYPLAGPPILNWVLYGYGVPALAFLVERARRFLTQQDGGTVMVLEAGALAFVTCLVTFEIRQLFAGSLDAAYRNLAETGVQTAAWLAMGYGLYVRRAMGDRKVLNAVSVVLRAVAVLHLVFIQVLFQNPLDSHVDVGVLPVIDLLSLAYLLPAIFAALYAVAADRRGDKITFNVAAGLALLLTLLWLSLEVRHAFQGRYLDGGSVTNAEQYSYTAVWLLYGAALFAAGLRWNSRALRIASLAIFMITVAKVFLFDISEITGIFRALSFLGLGAALIGVGYLYQRFVHQPVPADEDAAENPVSGP